MFAYTFSYLFLLIIIVDMKLGLSQKVEPEYFWIYSPGIWQRHQASVTFFLPQRSVLV